MLKWVVIGLGALIVIALGFVVIGIVPDAFTGLFELARPTFFVPLMMMPALEGAADDTQLTDRGRRALAVKGRLSTGVTREAASAEAAAIFAGSVPFGVMPR